MKSGSNIFYRQVTDMDESEKYENNNEENIPDVLAEFLDAETVEQKHKILEEHADELDERTVLNMEVSLDIVAKDNTTLDDRIGYILYYLRTRGRFESTRLRF